MPNCNEFNPCLCTTVRNGSLLISIFDVIYGLVYILRVYYLDWSLKEFKVFYPDPYPYRNAFVIGWMKYGNYVLMLVSGLILFIGIQFMRLERHYQVCYIWLGCRLFLTFTFSVLCHDLKDSSTTIYKYYAYEVLFNIIIHTYMTFVVFLYSREAIDEFRLEKTNNPIQLHTAHFKLRAVDSPHSFTEDNLTATSMYQMTPDRFRSTVPPSAVGFIRNFNSKSSDSESWNESMHRKYLGMTVSSKITANHLEIVPKSSISIDTMSGSTLTTVTTKAEIIPVPQNSKT